jgi:hypothetical protein
MIEHTLRLMLAAVAAADKTTFLAKSTEPFAKIAEPQFAAIAKNLAPHLKSGFTLERLGNLKRRSGEAAVFKVVFADAADEVMAMITEKEDKVAGLLLM